MEELRADKVIDQLVALTRLKESTTESGRRSALTLTPTASRRIHPHHRRSWGQVSPPVVQELKLLANGQADWPLFLHGPAGCGKTFAALCLLDHAPGSCFFDVPELAQLLIDVQQGRATWRDFGITGEAAAQSPHVASVWGWIASVPLVVLDELGTHERVSDHVYKCVKKVLDVREGKPLIVISNHGLDRIKQGYDDRITSRLSAGTVLALVGKDRRLKV